MFTLDLISVSSSTARAASLRDLKMHTCLISRHLSELNSKSQWSSNISCALSSFPRNHRSYTLNYTSQPHWAKNESEILRFNAFLAAMTKKGDDILFRLKGRRTGKGGKREEKGKEKKSWQERLGSSAEKAAGDEMLSTELGARKDQQLLSTSHRYCIKPMISYK